jgi:RNA polymerase sigma-70 factor (ECF subfamily)
MDREGAAQEREWSRLMQAAQAGDQAAYARLLREVAPFIRSLARRRSRDEDAIEDVVQEVLLCLHRVRHNYDPARPFTPWLAAICSRRAIDALRRRTRIAGHETRDDGAYETYPDPTSNKEVEANASAQLVASLVEGLPPAQRQALELLKLKELSLAEASAVSGQSVGGLKVSAHRAIKALRARLRLSD